VNATLTNPTSALERAMVERYGISEVEVLNFANDDRTHYRVKDTSGAVWWVRTKSLTFEWEEG